MAGFLRAWLVCVLVGTALVVAPSRADAAYVRATPAASWGVDGPVYATTVVGDVVVVGGRFSAAVSPTGATTARQNLAAFSLSTGALLTGWRADASAAVRALTTDGTAVYVGGSFTTIGGVARNRVARLSASTGAVDTGFRSSPSSTVRTVAVDGTSLYLGGDFTAVGGVARSRLAKVSSTTGALDTAFTGGADASVSGLAVSPTSATLYVVGTFTTLGGGLRRGVGAVSTTSGAVTGPSYAFSVSPTLDVDVNDDGTMIYVAAAEFANSVVAYDAATGRRVFRQTAMGDVQAVDYFNGVVYFGFHEGFGGDTALRLLAADARTGALDPDFRPTFNMFWGVWSITAVAGGLVVGGEFTRVSGVTARYWVRFRP